MPLRSTNAVVLSRPAGSWGAEAGANDHGVSVGCSHNSDAVTSRLTADDLVRSVRCHFITLHLYTCQFNGHHSR